jgi:hypothetical protein
MEFILLNKSSPAILGSTVSRPDWEIREQYLAQLCVIKGNEQIETQQHSTNE